MAEEQIPQYDEEEAIGFIRRTLPEEVNNRYSDDDLLEIIDALWDYYDESGATSLDNIQDEEDEYPDPASVAPKLMKVLAKNGPKAINIPDLTIIIKGEIAYEEDLGSRM